MIERIARAIAATDQVIAANQVDDDDFDWHGDEALRSFYLAKAQAVKAAMRELDPPLLGALVERGQAAGYTDVVGLWRAAIDAL